MGRFHFHLSVLVVPRLIVNEVCRTPTITITYLCDVRLGVQLGDRIDVDLRGVVFVLRRRRRLDLPRFRLPDELL